MEIGLQSLAVANSFAETNSPEAAATGEGEAFTKLLALVGVATEATPAVPEAVVTEAAVARSGSPAMVRQTNELPTSETSSDDVVPDPDTSADDADPSLVEIAPMLFGWLLPGPAPQAAPLNNAAPTGVGNAPRPSTTSRPPEADGERKAMEMDVASQFEPLAPLTAALGLKSPLRELRQPFGQAPTPARLEPLADDTPILNAVDGLAGSLPTPGGDTLPAGQPSMAVPGAVSSGTAPLADAAAPAIEPLIERQLNLAQDGEWLDQLARDIARTGVGEGHLRFRLNPENLGSLHVELSQGAAGTSVRLTADTEAARAILADAQPRLIAEARSQGLRIAEAHVDLGSHSHAQSQGGGQQDARAMVPPAYLTTWKPESEEEAPVPARRSTSERFA